MQESMLLKGEEGLDLTEIDSDSNSESDSGSDIPINNIMASQVRGDDLILDSEDEDGNLFSNFGIDQKMMVHWSVLAEKRKLEMTYFRG